MSGKGKVKKKIIVRDDSNSHDIKNKDDENNDENNDQNNGENNDENEGGNDENKIIEKPENQGWGPQNQLKIEIFMQKLKHNRAICNFFYFELKSTESKFSWWLIILSTLSTTLTGLSNIEDEPFDHYYLSIQASIGTFSVLTTLIAAWMKKQQYVDRINEIDRYVQKITQLIEEIDFQLTLRPRDRLPYVDFSKKYYQPMTEIFSTSPSLSPKEWKYTLYTITKYYPEIINQDGSHAHKLWPWFAIGHDGKEIVNRPKSLLGERIIKTYHSLTYKGIIFKKLTCCCKKFFCCNGNIMRQLEYMRDPEYVLKEQNKKKRDENEEIEKEIIERYKKKLEMVKEKNNISNELKKHVHDVKEIDEYIKEIINEGREEEYIIKLREEMNRTRELNKIKKKQSNTEIDPEKDNIKIDIKDDDFDDND